MKIDPTMVTTDVPDGYDEHTSASGTLIPFYSLRSPGDVFTVPDHVLPGVDADTLLVVLGTSSRDVYKAAKLGGDDGRYFPKVAAAAIRPVPLADLASYLS